MKPNRSTIARIIFTLSILMMTSVMWAQDSAPAAEDAAAIPRKVPVFVLEGPMVEMKDPLAMFGPQPLLLRDLTRRIDLAAKDTTVGGIVIRMARPQMGLAQATELRQNLVEFRQTGKPVVVLMDMGGLSDYVVASSADRVVMTPVGGLTIYGLSARLYFFKDLLAKLGMEAQAVHTGKFKTAFEPFTHSEMTEGTRIQIDAILDDYESYIIESVAKSRGMEPDVARTALWGGPYSSEGALEAGLITDIAYFDEFMDDFATENNFEYVMKYKESKAAQPEPPNLFTLFSGMGAAKSKRRGSGNEQIAVLYAVGPIIDGRKDKDPFASQMVIASEDFIEQIDEALEEAPTRALVLRVDSPGGSAVASDRIWRRLEQVRDDGIPVVVSMGNVAASGGYYISAVANKIVAEPTTITGSIGVIGGRVALGGTYEKIGVNKQTISRGPHAGLVDETRPWNEEETAIVEGLLEEVYVAFTSKVADGRRMPRDKVLEIAEGRVWTGAAAKEIGLVDELGSLDDAIGVARSLADAPNAEINYYPKELTFFELFEKVLAGEVVAPPIGVQSAPGAELLMLGTEQLIPAAQCETLWTVLQMMKPEPGVFMMHPMMFEIE